MNNQTINHILISKTESEKSIIMMEEGENETIDRNIYDNITKSVSNIVDTKEETYKIFIYGCSHCKCFIRERIKLNNIEIINKFISGASMSGIVRDISTLDYKSIINKNMKNNLNNYHVFKFGQVDVEYIYLHKTLIKNIEIQKHTFYAEII